LAVALAGWLNDHESDEDRERRHRAATRLSWRLDPDGMVAGSFRFPPGSAAPFASVVDAQVLRAQRGIHAPAGGSSSPNVTKWSWPSIAQQRADALLALLTNGGANILTEVVLHVRGDGCTLDDGTPIAGSVVERIAPTAFLRALIHDANGRPINASSRRRHPTTRQKRVVRERDRGCIDCGSTDLPQYDHQPDYEQTHHTITEELWIRCPTCHHKRHATPESRQ
jgi:hypothetical protein